MKKTTIISVILIIAAFLIGYGWGVQKGGVEEEAGEIEEEQVEKQEAKKEVIKIGAMLPLSGGSAKYGEWIQEGIELALEEVNNEPGENYKIEVIYEDDQCSPKIGADVMHKLTKVDQAPFVLGGWCSAVTLAAAPIAEDLETVFISFGASPEIRFAGDYIFRNKPDATLEAKESAPLVYNTLGFKNIAILYVNNDFGIGFKDTFEEHYRELGGEIISEEAFEYGATDFKTQLIKIKEKNPEAIFMVGYITEDGLILKQSRELGINQQFISTALFENSDIFDIAGEVVEGTMYSYYGIDEKSTLAMEYQDQYTTRYGHESEAFAAFAYDAIKLIGPIIWECGKDSDCIKNNLYRVKEVQGVTGLTSFDEYGDVIKPAIIKTVKNGQFVEYEQ